MLRELAGYDPERLRVVRAWPVREGLLAYRALLRTRVDATYTRDLLRYELHQLMFVHQGLKSRPRPPRRETRFD